MGLMDKLKLGKHYRMERFSILFGVLCVALLCTTVLCFIGHMNKQNSELGTQAIYSESFETSKTGVSGDVIDVFTSEDKTKTFLLLKFDDVNAVSTNANNYQMFLTGASVEQNKQTLDGIPSGSIYMFGNTGYMGIYLVNKDGFQPQILDLVVRCNSELQAPAASEDVDTEVEDKSFVDHDQFRVYFNPGASEAHTLECLNGDKAPSVTAFYNEAVILPQEEALHEQLTTQVDKLRVDLNQIAEYGERVENAGINLPEAPDVIAGDEVVANEDEKGNVESYTYKPATVVPGGYDLDWQNTSVVDGFLDDLISETDTPNMTVDQFFAMKNREEQGDASGNQLETDDIQWTLTTGTALDDLAGGSSDRYTQYVELTDNLTNAWRTYYNDKVDYQRDMLASLLDLEVAKDAVLTGSSVNTAENVLQCY